MDYSKQQFEQLFKGNYRQMYRMAYAILEDAEDAKDAVSQVFTQLWHSKPQVSDDSLTGYLLTATRNQCLQLLRQRRLREEMVEELKREQEERNDDERRELMNQLHQVIADNLTERDKQILSMHYVEEMTYGETAEALGISPSAVNKHITLSLATLRNKLKKAK